MAFGENTYPIAVLQDRYCGVYCGGEWLAIAQADRRATAEDVAFGSRFDVVYNGAHDSDPGAAWFGRKLPEWCAVGNTPDEAIQNLRRKIVASS